MAQISLHDKGYRVDCELPGLEDVVYIFSPIPVKTHYGLSKFFSGNPEFLKLTEKKKAYDEAAEDQKAKLKLTKKEEERYFNDSMGFLDKFIPLAAPFIRLENLEDEKGNELSFEKLFNESHPSEETNSIVGDVISKFLSYSEMQGKKKSSSDVN